MRSPGRIKTLPTAIFPCRRFSQEGQPSGLLRQDREWLFLEFRPCYCSLKCKILSRGERPRCAGEGVAAPFHSVQRLKLDGIPGPFQTFADAAALANSGKKEEAKSRLHSILGLPNPETRMQLWVWSALREPGERPDSRPGKEVLGVVVEMPIRTVLQVTLVTRARHFLG